MTKTLTRPVPRHDGAQAAHERGRHLRRSMDLTRRRLSPASTLCGSLAFGTAGLLAWMGGASSPASAQVATKVDFRRDIQPLLQEHCIECHGPDEQSGGFRFDNRRSVCKVAGRLQPGSSATSRMYLRLVNDDFGPRMPRDSELRPDQIAMVKNWIDQGAEWPDDLAGDDPAPPPPDPVATQMIGALRRGDARAFARFVRGQPQTINRRVIGGATPLMYAALYGDEPAVRLLFERGADPNIANEAGATALMWAVDDSRITTLLLDRGANVNAMTPEGHTALSIAAARLGAMRVVKTLLNRGASPSPEAPRGPSLSVSRPTVPLAQAASAGSEPVFRMLVERGADLKVAGGAALVNAARGECGACVEMLIGAVGKADLTYALVGLARYGDTPLLARLIDRGADVNGRLSRARRDIRERTPLLLAASSDLVHAETIRMLLARGAEINAVGPEGETALDLAKRNGETDVVRVLMEADARPGRGFPTVSATPQPAPSAHAAFARVVPLLQRSDVTFTQKTGCVSCHNNTLTAMTIAVARTQHLPFDVRIAASQREVIASLLAERREQAALGSLVQNTASNILTGLAAERHTGDVTTDVMAYFLKGRQSADGRWRNFLVDHRPPVQHSDIEATATAIRALRVYAPMPRRAAYERVVRRATTWLLTAQPRTVDERAWQLLGFAWAGVDAQHDRLRAAARSLLAEQRADGGWSQLPTLASDAYATGQALVALLQVGAVRSYDPPYRRGVEYPARLTTRRWVVVREVPRAGVPAVFRERVSTWSRPVGVDGRQQLGGDGSRFCRGS